LERERRRKKRERERETRKRSKIIFLNWIPASAGMTVFFVGLLLRKWNIK
jgi:hypothetical protein